MRVGLDDWRPEDADWFNEIGATITKMPLGDADKKVNRDFGKRLKAARAAGMDVIVDLRPSAEIEQAIMSLQVDPDKTDEKSAAVRAAWSTGIAEQVKAYGTDVYAWEVWGEFACPAVGGHYPSQKLQYPVLLADAANAIREVHPEALVWNGGYGVDFDRHWMDGILAADPDCETFTHQNWHHYNRRFYGTFDAEGYLQPGEPLHKRVRHSADLYRDLFRTANDTCPRPLVSSEWGLHVVSDWMVEGSRYCGLFSMTMDGGIPALGDTEAAAYLEAWFEVFEEAGMEVLVYHRLHDNALPQTLGEGDRLFWGHFCGLLYADGTPKENCLSVVKAWCQR